MIKATSTVRQAAAGVVVMAVALAATAALAQDAPSPKEPTAAAPAEGATPLPPIEVISKKSPAKKNATAKKAAPKPKSAPVESAASAPAPVEQLAPVAKTPAQEFDAEQAAATGPVDGYVPSATATGTKTATPIAEIPQSITVVTGEQMRDQAAKTIEGALRYAGGVFAEPYGFDSRGDYTSVRGTEPTRFLDGLKRAYYGYDFGKVDPFELERIEVLRGPASMLYGKHASGGLINMVSKRPQEKAGGEIGISYGSWDNKRVEFDSTGVASADGRWLYRLVGVAEDGETQMRFTDHSRVLLAPSLTFKPQAGTALTLLGHVQTDTASASTLGFFPNEGIRVAGPNGRISTRTNPANPDYDSYDTDNMRLSLLFDHRVNEYLSIHQSARYEGFEVFTRSMYADSYSSPNPYLDPERRTLDRIVYATDVSGEVWSSDTRAELRLATGPVHHKALVGFDYSRFLLDEDYRDMIDGRPFDVYRPNYTTTTGPNPGGIGYFEQFTNSEQEAFGYYFQDQMRLGPLIGIAGVRWDDVRDEEQSVGSQKSSALTKRFALIYETPWKLNPYVSYGESFEPVVGTDRNGAFFEPVRGELREVGFKYQPAPKTLIMGALYRLDELNRLTVDPENPNFEAQLGTTRVEGYEFEAHLGVTSNLNVIANYAWTNAKIIEGDGAGSVIELVPRDMAALWAVYTFDEGYLKGFSIGGGVRYVGTVGQDFWETKPFTLFDAMVAYETPEWRWALNGSNLEDEVYVPSCRAAGDCFYGQRLNVTTSLTRKF